MRPGIVICSAYLPMAARVSGSGLPASGRAEIAHNDHAAGATIGLSPVPNLTAKA
jgi:hypothetical protein